MNKATIICQKCFREFPESEVEESHDVPCYLFKGFGRKNKKQKADMFPRHWLCKECHKKYEEGLRMSFKCCAMDFSDKFFKEYNEKK
ncbi:MAG: hypothetical protein ACTSUG_00275 [Candidatus Helarchaeota archaeon]